MDTEREARFREDRFRNFWEMKAKKYPLPFDPENLKKTEEVISLVTSKGVETAGADILDIGCGTGIYTLPLARKALKVTGVDISEKMLGLFEEEAQRHGIHNWDHLQASWDSLDVSLQGFLRSFDIVWTSMSMAVCDEEDVKKMMLCSKQWCVYVGWGNKRKNTLMEEVFRIHSLPFGPPPGALIIYNLLKKTGWSSSLDFINTFWDWEGTVDETLEDLAGHIELTGHPAQRKLIRDVVSQMEVNGRVRHRTYVEEGVIVWRVI